MQDLRLVGVHDDGEHLLLSGTGGELFRLPIDEALRVAASRLPQRPVAPADGASAPRLSPRDIQMQIRSGATAEVVAESSGLPLAHIQRYEGPVLAEREHIASLAQKVEVSAAAPSHDGYRSAFGDDPATLGEMVRHRLAAFGINTKTLEWDAWRRPEGSWTVVANFDASGAGASIGEPSPAQWVFTPGRKTIQNGNRWAQQLSELEPLDGPVPARRLSAVADRPFDFESDAVDAGDDSSAPTPGTAKDDDSDDLLALLRARRGQRLGIDEDEDDALAMLLTHGVPAAHPRPGQGDDESSPAKSSDGAVNRSSDKVSSAGSDDSQLEGQTSLFPKLSLAQQPEEDPLALYEVSTDTREITIQATPSRKTADAENDSRGSDSRNSDSRAGGEPESRPASPAKPKRSSVPSWDEIVFGTKGD